MLLIMNKANNIDSGANYLGSDHSSAISSAALGKLLQRLVPQFPHLQIVTNVCHHKYPLYICDFILIHPLLCLCHSELASPPGTSF